MIQQWHSCHIRKVLVGQHGCIYSQRGFGVFPCPEAVTRVKESPLASKLGCFPFLKCSFEVCTGFCGFLLLSLALLKSPLGEICCCPTHTANVLLSPLEHEAATCTAPQPPLTRPRLQTESNFGCLSLVVFSFRSDRRDSGVKLEKIQ